MFLSSVINDLATHFQFQCDVRRFRSDSIRQSPSHVCFKAPGLGLGLNNSQVIFHVLLPKTAQTPLSSLCLTWSESRGPTRASTPYHTPLRPLKLRATTSHRPLILQEYLGGLATALLSDISTERVSTSFAAPSLTYRRPTTPRMRVPCHPRRFRYPQRVPSTSRKHFGPS